MSHSFRALLCYNDPCWFKGISSVYDLPFQFDVRLAFTGHFANDFSFFSFHASSIMSLLENYSLYMFCICTLRSISFSFYFFCCAWVHFLYEFSIYIYIYIFLLFMKKKINQLCCRSLSRRKIVNNKIQRTCLFI